MIDKNQLKEIAKQYIDDFSENFLFAPTPCQDIEFRHAGRTTDCRTQMNHALWMCQRIINMADDNFVKAYQWLGFVQGIFWSHGFKTLDQLRKDYKKER